jgi:hypothetical protein
MKYSIVFIGWYNSPASDKVWGFITVDGYEDSAVIFWGKRTANLTFKTTELAKAKKTMREKANDGYSDFDFGPEWQKSFESQLDKFLDSEPKASKPTVRDMEGCFYGAYQDPATDDYVYYTGSFLEVSRQYNGGEGDEMQYLFVVRHKETLETWGAYIYHDSWHEEPLDLNSKDIFPVVEQEVTIKQWVAV